MVVTKSDLHQALLKLRETYQRKVESLDQDEAIDTLGTGYTNHQADDATAVYEQTVSASTARAVTARLRDIEDALARYDNGTYGVCEDCGTEIDLARLEAIPYTRLCLRCAEARDYNAGM